jgi:hypothetical protein
MKTLRLMVFVLGCRLLALGQSATLDTTHLGVSAGSGFAAHVAYCQTILPASGGTCDGSYEPAQMTTATVTISSSNVVVILPPVTLTLGTGFLLTVTGSNSGFLCQQQWSCVLDASNNTGVGTIALGASAGTSSGDFVNNIKMIGGRLNKQTGNEVVMTGTSLRFTNNWSVNAGRDAVALTACNYCVVHYNIVDQSAAAAILVSNSSNSTTSNFNDIGFNLTRDANVNVVSSGQTANTQGTIGASCSAPACSSVPPTAHLADYNSIHDNVILNQYFPVGSPNGNCSNPNVGPVAISSWTGTGTVVTFTFTTALPAGGIFSVGQTLTFSGFTNTGTVFNGNTFAVLATPAPSTTTISISSSTTLGVSSAGSVTFTPTTGDTGCSEGIQDTDTAWNNKIVNNTVINSAKEALDFSGLGNTVTGNRLDACGQSSINGSFSGCIAWEKSSQVQASPGYVGDTVIANNVMTNTASFVMRYGIQVLFTGTASYPMNNMTIANNTIDGTAGGGILNAILLNANTLTGTITLSNFRINGNSIIGSVTNPFNPVGYANFSGRVQTGIGEFLLTSNTQYLASDSSAITATTPGTVVFTWGSLPLSSAYSFHCGILYSQATASAANGMAVQGASASPVRLDAWGKMDISNPASANYTGSAGSALNITTTTATSVVTATPAATGTVYQASLDGTIQANSSNATTLNVLVFTGNATDALTVKAGSYCRLMP